jgi:hypothetical protein
MTRVNCTVGVAVSARKQTGPVYRWNRPVLWDYECVGTVLGWEPDRFMYRAGPVPPGTGRTGPVPTGSVNPVHDPSNKKAGNNYRSEILYTYNLTRTMQNIWFFYQNNTSRLQWNAEIWLFDSPSHSYPPSSVLLDPKCSRIYLSIWKTENENSVWNKCPWRLAMACMTQTSYTWVIKNMQTSRAKHI